MFIKILVGLKIFVRSFQKFWSNIWTEIFLLYTFSVNLLRSLVLFHLFLRLLVLIGAESFKVAKSKIS